MTKRIYSWVERRLRGALRHGGRGSERGASLLAVVVLMVAVLLVGVALLMVGSGEGDLVEFAVDGARAFYVAEGGLDRTLAWLSDATTEDPDMDPVGTIFQDQALGGGVYTSAVVSGHSVSGIMSYDLVSTGVKDGVTRQVRVTAIEETFARYQWFVERGGWKWFETGERFEGPIHLNRQLQIDGDPYFGGKVTTAAGITMKPGSNPTFVEGYELNAPEIALPTYSVIEDGLRAASLESDGLFLGTLNGNNAYYEVIFAKDGMTGYMSYRSYSDTGGGGKPKLGGGYVFSPWVDIDLSAINGAVWFEDDVTIQGTVDGALTVGSSGRITITGDILYEDSTPGAGPNDDCDDVLGMIAAQDVIIEDNAANQSDCEVHGVMMALEKNLEAEDYMHGSPRGQFIVWGGIIVDQSIHLARYANGVLQSGYYRDYHYDSRLALTPPPFFPLTGHYVLATWSEVIPPEEIVIS